MIDLIFYQGTEIVFIRVQEKNIMFASGSSGNKFGTIDGLKFNYNGVVKEFPDLKDSPVWKEEAIKRFKEKIRAMNDEEEIANYIIQDLKKYAYVPKWKQKQGFRREVIK